MTNESKNRNPSRDQVFQSIKDSWSAETCATPQDWSPKNPSWQQCDASAFVAWEYLGGELVLGKVTVDGRDAGYHYWNRIDGIDFDLTRTQFTDGENICEAEVLTDSFLRDNAKDMKPEVSARIKLMSEKVSRALTIVPQP